MSLEVIKKYNISAKKSLGQNFLVDENIIWEISGIIDIMWSDIIEVGPGYGVLTEKLLEKSPRSLCLVELDRDMISILEERFSGHFSSTFSSGSGEQVTDFQVIHSDILEYSPSFQKYSVIANIPYYITSPILRHFLYALDHTPESMVILMQKDVGDRILEKHKNKSSVLSLIVQKKCRVSEKILVPKESFIPQPKIESSVLFFETHSDFRDVDDESFLKFIKTGFSEPRKKLIKNLIKGGYEKQRILEFFGKNNLSENTRWEDLNVKMWCQLLEKLS